MISRLPSDDSSLVQAGDSARDAGNLDAAVAIYRRIAESSVDGALGHFKIGTVYSRMNRDNDAEQSYVEAIKRRPGYPQAINNLALLCAMRRDFVRAETLHRELLAEQPDFFESHLNLGNLLLDTGRVVEAQYQFRRALLLSPQSALVHDRLGVALRSRARLSEAVSHIRRAVELDPAFHAAWNNLGTCHFVLGNHAEAEAAFRTSLDLHPEQTEAWSNWLLLSNLMSVPRDQIAERHRSYGRHLRALCGPLANPPVPHPEAAHRRLRLGFVSGDFRRHSVAYFLQDALRSIDKDEFELFAYATFRYQDHVTDRLRPLFAEWRELDGLSDNDAVGLIKTDCIDILIDLSGHTTHNRLPVFACKPAPIQVSWIGYPNTTGLDCIDYRLTDSLVDPDPDEDALYTEKLFRLPGSFLCFSPPDETAPSLVDQYSSEAGPITFGSFNARVKLGDECIELWSRTLIAVPGSRLIIKCYEGVEEDAARQDLIARFSANGLDSSRIRVLGRADEVDDHLAAYAEIDVALDSYPYNGTTTTCEALWMGVPVLTLAGDRHASRVGLALLTRLGFPQWVARTPDEMADKAIALVADRSELAQLRTTLRLRMRQSELVDGDAMGRRLGAAFRTMWTGFCAPPTGDLPAQLPEDHLLARLVMLVGTARHEELAAEARRVLEATPGQSLALKALAVALIAQGRDEDAYMAARESAQVSPGDPEAVGNLAIAASRLRHWHEAREVFAQAVRLAPTDPELFERLATCELVVGEAADADRHFARSVALDRGRLDAWNGWLFATNFHDVDRREVFDRHCQFGKLIRSICGPIAPGTVRADLAGRKLRLGFVSGDLGQHSVAYFLQGPLRALDREAFELFAYSSLRLTDPLATRLRSHFSVWREVDPAAAAAAAELIRADAIDVLFDLAGHTANNGLLIFGYRPAPVQVSWIGYPNTTGMDCIDYRITDAMVDPDPADDAFHTEKLVRLDRPFLCYSPPSDAPPVGLLPYQRKGYITFGSLNTRAKLGNDCIRLWSSVLKRLPDSRLIIKSYSGLDEAAACNDLRARFARWNVDPGRLDIRGASASISEHLAVYQEIDIALDSFPYNGTTITCESLWMGVPVISMRGDRHASRVGAMLLSQVGQEGCVANSAEEFAEKALELAAAPDRLAAIRSSLRARMAISPLLDEDSMGLHLGNAIRSFWSSRFKGLAAVVETSADIQPGRPAAVATSPIQPQPRDADSTKPSTMRLTRQRLDPDSIALMKLVEARRHQDTERLARRVLARRPEHPLALRALSVALIGLGQFDNALPIVKQAVRKAPKDPELLNNLGIVQSALMLWGESVSAFQGALALSPEDPEIHRNLGLAYFRMHRWTEAVPPLLKAVELHPGDFVDAIGILALALINDNRIDEAMVCFEELVRSFPDDAAAHYLYLKAALYQCKWGDLAASIARVWATCDGGLPFNFDNPSPVLSIPGASNARIRCVTLSFADRNFGGLKGAEIRPVPAPGERRLRIGYLSGDFRVHPVGYVLPKVIENHDRRRVETWGFSVGRNDASATRRRFEKGFDHFLDLEKVGVGDTVSQIRAASVDILVDLSGWSTFGRPEVLALRCAPIQVNWLGYAGTMGLEGLADYIVADSVVLPIEHAGFYSETVAHLPHSFMPVDPRGEEWPPSSRASEGLSASGVVFCSFNSCYKFNPQVFDLWCRLLLDVPGSVLWLSSMLKSAEANLRVEAQARGVSPERLIISRFAKSRSEHLARLQLADIALDPFPYNSHSTGAEILQAGVPMVSLLGETFAGRVGASLLHAAGLQDLVAENQEDYYRLAFRLATSPVDRAAMRARVNRARQSSPLVDMESFARSLEDLYFRMWSDACAGVRKPLLAT